MSLPVKYEKFGRVTTPDNYVIFNGLKIVNDKLILDTGTDDYRLEDYDWCEIGPVSAIFEINKNGRLIRRYN